MDKKVDNKSDANKFLLVVLSLLFCFTLYITLNYIYKHYTNIPKENEEIIEIKTEEVTASIVNNGVIHQIISEESFKKENEIIVENINVIEVASNVSEEKKFDFNIRYNITKNDFNANDIASNKSEVLVKFSYSYDKEKWVYVNNVISTNTSNIAPLIGNNYDIAGLTTKLNVVTNFEVTANKKEPTIMYWRSETIFKNLENNENIKELNANFTIEHIN